MARLIIVIVGMLLSLNSFAQHKYKDALLQDLRGNVKVLTYVYSQESDALGSIDYDSQTEYKSNGEQIRTEDKCCDRKRDSKGRIIYEKYIVDSEPREFKYIYGSNGMIERVVSIDSEGTQTDYYSYNNKGGLTKVVIMVNNKETQRSNYTITAYDAKGNWTERKSKTEDGKLCTESRVIEYW